MQSEQQIANQASFSQLGAQLEIDYEKIEKYFANLSIFEFFNISPTFLICEKDLRSRYFAICRYFLPKNEEILKKTHENYKKMQSPIGRLDALFKHFGAGNMLDADLEDANCQGVIGSHTNTNIPDDILCLSTKLFALEPSERPEFATTIKGLNAEIEREIQRAFEQRDWEALKQLKTRLSYGVKLLDSVYELLRD
ncbi:MAG: hypothetical protein LBF84_02430 [Holosporales bacterium]|jgi:hypothetical protein|nr:hypothetical protein [Holosporales bacterium]